MKKLDACICVRLCVCVKGFLIIMAMKHELLQKNKLNRNLQCPFITNYNWVKLLVNNDKGVPKRYLYYHIRTALEHPPRPVKNN